MRLRVRLPNQEYLEAPLEEWVSAILLNLPDHLRDRILSSMHAKMIAYDTPGSYILHAEPPRLIIRG